MQDRDNLGLSIRRDETVRGRHGSGPGARRTPRRSTDNQPKARMDHKGSYGHLQVAHTGGRPSGTQPLGRMASMSLYQRQTDSESCMTSNSRTETRLALPGTSRQLVGEDMRSRICFSPYRPT